MKTILVPLDFSDAAAPVSAVAQRMANAFGSTVLLLNVIEPEPDYVGLEPSPVSMPAFIRRDYEAEKKRLNALAAEYLAAGCVCRATQTPGVAVSAIIDAANESGAELIVMGSHGHGALYELLAGSVTHGVLKDAPCPVLVVPVRKKP